MVSATPPSLGRSIALLAASAIRSIVRKGSTALRCDTIEDFAGDGRRIAGDEDFIGLDSLIEAGWVSGLRRKSLAQQPHAIGTPKELARFL